MASLQSLRELISNRLYSAAQDISSRFEENTIHYEEDRRRLLELTRKPQSLLYSIVLPQHDPGSQERSSRVKQENQGPPPIKEEICIIQDEEQVELKDETGTLMETSTYGESRTVDQKSQQLLTQSFNGTDEENENQNQHKESTSATHEETDRQSRNQRKRSCHVTGRECVSGEAHKDCGKRQQVHSPAGKDQQNQKRKRFSCKECGKSFRAAQNHNQILKAHMKLHSE